MKKKRKPKTIKKQIVEIHIYIHQEPSITYQEAGTTSNPNWKPIYEVNS